MFVHIMLFIARLLDNFYDSEYNSICPLIAFIKKYQRSLMICVK